MLITESEGGFLIDSIADPKIEANGIARINFNKP